MVRIMWTAPVRIALIQMLTVVCTMPVALAAQSTSVGTKAVELNSKEASQRIENQVAPKYPPIAKLNYIQGKVLLQILVAPNGHVTTAHALRGHPLLAASALKAIRQWIYRPFKSGAGPVPFLTEVKVKFVLSSTKLAHFPSHPDKYLRRQVQPPKVLKRPASATSSPIVRMHVLVGKNSQIIDSFPISGSPKFFRAAQKELHQWKFRPAYWGAMKVPWYLDVDVPISQPPASLTVPQRTLPGTAPGQPHSALPSIF